MNFKVNINYGRNILIIKMTFDFVILLRLFAVRASSGYFSTEEQNLKLWNEGDKTLHKMVWTSDYNHNFEILL